MAKPEILVSDYDGERLPVSTSDGFIDFIRITPGEMIERANYIIESESKRSGSESEIGGVIKTSSFVFTRVDRMVAKAGDTNGAE